MEDRTEAISEVAQMFFLDRDDPTFGFEFLEPQKLDFSLSSLHHVNEYLNAVRKEKGVEEVWNQVVLRAGAYVGEVIRRSDERISWAWIDFQAASTIEPQLFESFGRSIATAIVLHDGNKGFAFPLGKVEKYLNNGSEDNLHSFAEIILSLDS